MRSRELFIVAAFSFAATACTSSAEETQQPAPVPESLRQICTVEGRDMRGDISGNSESIQRALVELRTLSGDQRSEFLANFLPLVIAHCDWKDLDVAMQTTSSPEDRAILGQLRATLTQGN